MQHYNTERPHQGRSCRNQPPGLGASRPAQFAPTASSRGPGRLLQAIHGQTYARRVKTDGCVQVDGIGYYVKQALAGHKVTLWVNATQRCFDVMHNDTIIKQIPLKGLQGKRMLLDDYIAFVEERARSEERQRVIKQRRRLLQVR